MIGYEFSNQVITPDMILTIQNERTDTEEHIYHFKNCNLTGVKPIHFSKTMLENGKITLSDCFYEGELESYMSIGIHSFNTNDKEENVITEKRNDIESFSEIIKSGIAFSVFNYKELIIIQLPINEEGRSKLLIYPITILKQFVIDNQHDFQFNISNINNDTVSFYSLSGEQFKICVTESEERKLLCVEFFSINCLNDDEFLGVIESDEPFSVFTIKYFNQSNPIEQTKLPTLNFGIFSGVYDQVLHASHRTIILSQPEGKPYHVKGRNLELFANGILPDEEQSFYVELELDCHNVQMDLHMSNANITGKLSGICTVEAFCSLNNKSLDLTECINVTEYMGLHDVLIADFHSVFITEFQKQEIDEALENYYEDDNFYKIYENIIIIPELFNDTTFIELDMDIYTLNYLDTGIVFKSTDKVAALLLNVDKSEFISYNLTTKRPVYYKNREYNKPLYHILRNDEF